MASNLYIFIFGAWALHISPRQDPLWTYFQKQPLCFLFWHTAINEMKGGRRRKGRRGAADVEAAAAAANCFTIYHRLFFWTFSRLWRMVDLPEILGFWRFYLEFWVKSWVFDKFFMILDKNVHIWLKIFLKIWKSCRNFEFLAKNSWVLSFFSLSFSFFHLEF